MEKPFPRELLKIIATGGKESGLQASELSKVANGASKSQSKILNGDLYNKIATVGFEKHHQHIARDLECLRMHQVIYTVIYLSTVHHEALCI